MQTDGVDIIEDRKTERRVKDRQHRAENTSKQKWTGEHLNHFLARAFHSLGYRSYITRKFNQTDGQTDKHNKKTLTNEFMMR